MVLSIPGGCGLGLFSQLQLALTHSKGRRVCIHWEVRNQIEDFLLLVQDLTSCPTQLAKIIPTESQCLGCCNAARSGMGGVWLLPDEPTNGPTHPPLVWCWAHLHDIQQDLISYNNPSGTITNSDFK